MVGTLESVCRHILFELIATEPRGEDLAEIPISDDQSRRQQDLRHVIEVPIGNETFQSVDLAQRDGESEQTKINAKI